MRNIQHKIMDLGVGEVFGEDMICYGIANAYSVKVESTQLSLLSIERTEFSKKYKRMV